MRKQVAMAILGLASSSALAGTIYKCKEGGTVSYHDRPCGPGAVALSVQPASAPAPDAQQRHARERAMLHDLETARAAREQQDLREAARADKAAAALKRRCDKLRLQRKWADEDLARAGRDEAERARTKARRQAESLAVECPA